jgi:hypothetical protein
MIQIEERLQRLLNNGVRLPPFDVNHKSYAAGFVLKSGVVQTLAGRRTGPLPLTGLVSAICSDRHVLETAIPTITETKFR